MRRISLGHAHKGARRHRKEAASEEEYGGPAEGDGAAAKEIKARMTGEDREEREGATASVTMDADPSSGPRAKALLHPHPSSCTGGGAAPRRQRFDQRHQGIAAVKAIRGRWQEARRSLSRRRRCSKRMNDVEDGDVARGAGPCHRKRDHVLQSVWQNGEQQYHTTLIRRRRRQWRRHNNIHDAGTTATVTGTSTDGGGYCFGRRVCPARADLTWQAADHRAFDSQGEHPVAKRAAGRRPQKWNRCYVKGARNSTKGSRW